MNQNLVQLQQRMDSLNNLEIQAGNLSTEINCLKDTIQDTVYQSIYNEIETWEQPKTQKQNAKSDKISNP